MRAWEFAGVAIVLMWSAGCADDTSNSGGSPPTAGSGEGGGGGDPLGGAGGSPTVDPADALRERLTPLLDELATPPFGTAASITVVSGDVTVTVTTGTIYDRGPAADDETCFNVASVSKLLTAARIVSLADAGSLGLDDALVQHLPGVRLLDSLGVDQSGVVTIRDLLRHRGGLPHQPDDLVEQAGGDFSDPYLLGAMTESWDIELIGNPGQYSYSNLGYALLGAIAETAEDCSFAGCMMPYLDELDMPRSRFWPDMLDDNAAHGRVESGSSVDFNPPTWYSSRYFLPFGGLWTPSPELAQFGLVLAAADEDLESPLHEMTTGTGHGLGPVHGQRLGASTLEHDGSAPGFLAALIVIPSLDIVVAIMTNGGNEDQDQGEAFQEIVEDIVEAVPE
jgi:CubicO group peptidase (beta-lactamase class C family)